MTWLLRACFFFPLLLHCLLVVDGPVPPYTPPPIDISSAKCLKNALWHEARGESLEGQRAVFEVIQHRVKKLKKDTCKVLAQPGQFPWFQGRWKEPSAKMDWMLVSAQYHPRILNDEKFLYFYSLKVLDRPPYWAARMTCKPIGNHAFCKENK